MFGPNLGSGYSRSDQDLTKGNGEEKVRQCSKCNGNGEVKVSEKKIAESRIVTYKKCNECNGRGNFLVCPCDNCSGSGKITCRKCKGKGEFKKEAKK